MENSKDFKNSPEMKATARMMLKLRKQREEREAAYAPTPHVGQTTVVDRWNGAAWDEVLMTWDGSRFASEVL